MQASKSVDDRQSARHDARRDTSTRTGKLDDRYGKIGIPAVAAAVRCRGQERKSHRVRLVAQESD